MLVLFLSGPAPEDMARLRALESYFHRAAVEVGIDENILKVISYRLTRFHRVKPYPDAEAVPQYGVMGIFKIEDAEKVSGISRDRIVEDDWAGIKAGALLLRHYLDVCGGDLPCALEMYAPPGAQRVFARDMLMLLKSGVKFPVLGVRPRPDIRIPEYLMEQENGSGEGLLSCPPGPEFPLVERWVAADPSNYTSANRPSDYPINYIIIHTTQGTYYGATNCQTGSGTGYNDGEGFVEYNGWYTDTLYRKSAYISRMAANTFGFPKDRNHIIGHSEVPGATHTDPGDYWDWAYYTVLVNGLPPADTIVDELSQGFRKYGPSKYWYYDSANGYGAYGHMWHTGSWSGVANWAKWTPNLPYTGPYEVFAYIPAGAQYDAYVPYIVNHAGGTDTVWIDQGNYSSQWVSLGTYNFNAGSSGYVILLDSSTVSGDRIAFDAIRWSWRGSTVCGDKVVDDGDAGWTGFGTWTLSSYSGYNGDYRYAYVGGTPDSSVWFSDLGCFSGYVVYAWVRKGSNRSTSVHYRIYADDGVRDVYVSQYSARNGL